jgi:choline dehydrogenase-like flavoprotein
MTCNAAYTIPAADWRPGMMIDRTSDYREPLLRDDESCDVCVIGSGAGGASVAYALQRAGVGNIVILEQGIWRDSPDWKAEHDNDEVYWSRRRMSRAAEKGEEYTLASFDGGKEFRQHRIGVPYGVVGGLTVVYTCANWRFRREDFLKHSLYGDAFNRMSAGQDWPQASLIDWPGNDFYADLEPYYTKAEQLLGVSGDWDSDPATRNADPARRLYRSDESTYLPKLPYHRSNELFADAAQALSTHPFPIPMGISSTEYRNGLKPCVSCNFCSGYPCVWDAKNSVDLVLLKPIRQEGSIRIVSNVTARVIEHDGNDAVEGVLYSPNGSKELRRVRARVVVLAAGATASPRLLQWSEHEQGRQKKPAVFSNANIGRYLTFHVDAKRGVYLDHDERLRTENMPYLVKKMAVMDEYVPRGADADKYINHASIQSGSKGGPIAFALKAARADWHKYRSQYDLQAIVEDLPVRDNRVELAPDDHRDAFGDLRTQVVHKYHPMDVTATLRTMEYIDAIIQKTGGAAMDRSLTDAAAQENFVKALQPNGSHAMGTIRMGADPMVAAADPDGRLWKGEDGARVRNLYIADASLFPTSAGLNPGLTVEALAFRVADRLLENHPDLVPRGKG